MKKILYAVFCSFFLSSPVFASQNYFVQVTQIQGLIQIQKQGNAQWQKASDGAQLFSGDKIRSFLESSSLLVFPDKSEFILGENSFLEIKDVSRNPRTEENQRELKLNLGSLHYKVTPQEDTASEFKIYSSTAIVGITGTEGIFASAGEGKKTQNVLIEGSTYNTDAEGNGGSCQSPGNVYRQDSEGSDMFFDASIDETFRNMSFNPDAFVKIKDLVARFESKKSQGYNVFEVESLIDDAVTLGEQKNYIRMEAVVAKALALLENASKIQIDADLQKKIHVLEEKMKAKEVQGYDVADIYIILDKIYSNINAKKWGTIESLIVQITQRLETLSLSDTGSTDHVGFWTQYDEIQTRIIHREEKGFVLEEVKVQMRKAKMFYDNGDMPNAYQALRTATLDLQKAVKILSADIQSQIEKFALAMEEKRQQGYAMDEMDSLRKEIDSAVEAESFIKVKALLASAQEKMGSLVKVLPVEWDVKINALQSEIKYKSSLGFDLSVISDLLKDMDFAVAQGDLVEISRLYTEGKKALAELGFPQGFHAKWEGFLSDLKDFEEKGFDVKKITYLKKKIQNAMKSGDLKSARKILSKAINDLAEIKDEKPPLAQILSFDVSDNKVFLKGFVSDNTKVKRVFVNQSLVDFSDKGEFEYATVLTVAMDAVSIVVEDIAGNVSPTLILELPSDVSGEDYQAEIADARVSYLDDGVIVSGVFFPGAKVTVSGVEGYCDAEGKFSILLTSKGMEARKSIVLWGYNSDGEKSNEVVLSTEDKWPPEIDIQKVSFPENITPALYVDPFLYSDAGVTVTGRVEFRIMVNLEGQVKDRGGKMVSLRIDGKEMDYSEDGRFWASVTVPSDTVVLSVEAADDSGNMALEKIAIDSLTQRPRVLIEQQEVPLGRDGHFLQELSINSGMKDLHVSLVDRKGNQKTSQTFPLSRIFPPSLDVVDVVYTADHVIISGVTDKQAAIIDKTELLFPGEKQAGDDGSFEIVSVLPEHPLDIVLIAKNAEGKYSQEVAFAVAPPVDDKAPELFVSLPQFTSDSVIVSGFAEDDSGVAELTVNGTSIDLADGKFFHEVALTADLEVIEVVASDLFANQSRKVIAVKDEELPQLVIDEWTVSDGKLKISGKATDNVGMKEVRLNKMPLVRGTDKELFFSYEGVLTEDSRNVIIYAVDLMNHQISEGPREIEIPEDSLSPIGEAVKMKYGSPVIYVSGKVSDPAGIKAVYVDGEAVDVLDDGTFNVKKNIMVDPPQIIFEAPSYANGMATVSGKVVSGIFSPETVMVEAEDLMGNRGVLFTQKVEPYLVDEIFVSIDGDFAEVNESGDFSKAISLVVGVDQLEVKAVDPFENSSMEILELEKKAPLLSLEDLDYESQTDAVLLSGKVSDLESGISSLTVNGVRVQYAEDGVFSCAVALTESSVNVVATDYIGNITSISEKIVPPDVWGPVFQIDVNPVPAVIGSQVSVDITVVDALTGILENLQNLPRVSADIGGVIYPLTVEGEGSRYLATLDTRDLTPALVTLLIEGEDVSGNQSSDIEGEAMFTLVSDDEIVPVFTMEVEPDPCTVGEASTIKIFSSERLKTLPQLQVVFPSGETRALSLSKVDDLQFGVSLNLSLDEALGALTLRLTGGEDFSGNVHAETVSSVPVVAPLFEDQLPLSVDVVDFISSRLKLIGTTAPDAVVHMEAGDHVVDIVSDEQGRFRFEKPIDIETLKAMHREASSLKIKLNAYNYAGFKSPLRVLDVTLPPLPEESEGAFRIVLDPPVVFQGGQLKIHVESDEPVDNEIYVAIYTPDGTRVPVLLAEESNGSYLATYAVPEDALLGRAMLEVVSGDIKQSVYFEVVLSAEWMQVLNAEEFYKIRIVPDPMILGEEAKIMVDTEGDLALPPEMIFVSPDGKTQTVALSGGPRNFIGTYTCPSEMGTGKARLVLNPGTQVEVSRSVGIEEPSSEVSMAGAFMRVNPQPLIAGAPFEMMISFAEAIDFIPILKLKLMNGDVVSIPVKGSLPANRFEVKDVLASDIVTGLAKFVLKDDQGVIINVLPTQVIPAAKTMEDFNAFVIPSILEPLALATIQVDAAESIPGTLNASISFSDGSVRVLPLEIMDYHARAVWEVAEDVPLGLATVTISDDVGNIWGTIRVEIVEQVDASNPGGVKIYLDNPDFAPEDNVRVDVETTLPLSFIPQASLIYDQGELVIELEGSVPGNRFSGNFVAPLEDFEQGKIVVKDDADFVLGELSVNRSEEGQGDIILTPMPPVLNQPLSVKVIAPSPVVTAPVIRFITETGESFDANAFGVLPGDTFVASLKILEKPLSMIEVIHEGEVVLILSITDLVDESASVDFSIQLSGDFTPGSLVDVDVVANVDVPFIPELALDVQGVRIKVPLNGVAFSRDFFGILTIPVDMTMDQDVTALIYDAQGNLIWQKTIATAQDAVSVLPIVITPEGSDGFDIGWPILSGIDQYVLKYGETKELASSIDIQGQSQYSLEGLVGGTTYYFQVEAYKDGKKVIVSDVLSAVCGQTQKELYVQATISDNTIHLTWNDYASADRYRIQWGNASGVWDSVFETSEKSCSLSDLNLGDSCFIKVEALQAGLVIGQSREMEVVLDGASDYQGNVTITVTPDPPVVNESLQVSAEFSEMLYFQPKLFVTLSNGERMSFDFSPKQPNTVFEATIPSAELTLPVKAVEVEDDLGMILGEIIYSSDVNFNVYLSCVDTTTIDVSWDEVAGADSYQIFYGNASGNYNGEFSPVTVGQGTLYDTLKDLDAGKIYYVKVEAYNANNVFIQSTPEQMIDCLGGVVEYPGDVWVAAAGTGEIKVGWNTVPGVDGYRIYFGTASGSYTESGSPIEITDPNVGTWFINGLITGKLYYIKVQSFIGDLESQSPLERSVFPGSAFGGSGAFSATPMPLEFTTINPGSDTETQTITISNEVSTSFELSILYDDIVKVGTTTSIDSSNIHVSPSTFTLAASGSQSVSVYISIPSSGISTGPYATMLTFYNDADEDGTLDAEEDYLEVPLTFSYGLVAGITIAQSHITLGTLAPGDESSWATFNYTNVSGSTYSSLTTHASDLTCGSEIISGTNVDMDVSLPSLSSGASDTASFKITIPAGTAIGSYDGVITIFNDTNNNGSVDSDTEPSDTFFITVDVASATGSLPITNVWAEDRGTGGAIDLYWTDPNDNTEYYNVLYGKVGSGLSTTSTTDSSPKTMQFSGLIDGIQYRFRVEPVIAGTAVTTDHEVYATPTTSGTDITPPTFAGLQSAYATGVSGKVQLEWEAAADISAPITYYIYRGISSTNLSLIAQTTAITYLDTGLSNGTTYYYQVRAEDNEGNREYNNHIESATPGANVNEIEITGDTSSIIGNPVLVTLTAKDANGDVVNFNDPVNITVDESDEGAIPNSWLLSIQDRVSGDFAEVEMYEGKGYFTVDALEPEILTISVVGISSTPLSITFVPENTGAGSMDSVVMQGPSRVAVGSTAYVWVIAIDEDNGGMLATSNFVGQYAKYGPASAIDPNATGDGDKTYTVTVVDTSIGSWEGGSYQKYLFKEGNPGKALLAITDTEAETLTFTEQWQDTPYTYTLEFVNDIDKFIVQSGGSYDESYDSIGSRIKFTAFAATAGGEVIRGFNGNVSVVISNDANHSAYVSPSTVTFEDGRAEFYIENSEFETLTFKLDDGSGTTSSDIPVSFLSTDNTAPEVTDIVAETPYLIHIYFSEEIDSTTARIISNYSAPQSIHTVCWYNDNVTLHLDSPMTLGASRTVDVKGTSVGVNGIKDLAGNQLADVSPGFIVPLVDYQGGTIQGTDWFEIQPSVSSVSSGETFKVTVYHKNACGYLTGSNNVNKHDTVGSAQYTLTRAGVTIDGADTGTLDLSDGVDSFEVKVTGGSCGGGSIAISVTDGTVSEISVQIVTYTP